MNPTWIEENGNKVFPITHNRAILGGLSYKAYNIDDAVYGNNWNNVIDNGFYYDNNGTNRPPVGINTYPNKLLVEVFRTKNSCVMQRLVTDNTELFGNTDRNYAGNIKDKYSRIGVESSDGTVTWGEWHVNNPESLTSRTYVENTGSTATVRTITINGITSLDQLKDKVIFIKALNVGSASVTTINVNNLGAKQIRMNRSSGLSTGLISNWVRAGQIYSVSYDGTYFNLLSSGNREEPYLPLSGGIMSGPISTAEQSSWINGLKGTNSIINSTSTGSQHTTLWKKNSTNGAFILYGYQNTIGFGYQNNSTIASGDNGIAYSVAMDENGCFRPYGNNTQNLGSTSYKWANVYATTFNGNLSGNASSATKLQTARTINGVAFDGTKNITIDVGGSGHTILNSSGTAMTQRSKLRFNNATVTDDAENDVTIITPSGTSGNYLPLSGGELTGNVTPTENNTLSLGTSSLKFSTMYATTFYGALSGNASTATTLANARTINGTSFNGSANITTTNWGTARNIGIVNSDGTGTPVLTSVNGSANVNLKLPATIKAALSGNASSATQVKVTDTSPTTATNYSLVFTNATATGNADMRINYGDLLVRILEGTTTSVGQDVLYLGNSVASGTAGNKEGRLLLYSSSSGYDTLYTSGHTGQYTHLLPGHSGLLIDSSNSSVTNMVSLTKAQYDSQKDSLPDGTIVNITDSDEAYVTTKESSITCDLPLDL